MHVRLEASLCFIAADLYICWREIHWENRSWTHTAESEHRHGKNQTAIAKQTRQPVVRRDSENSNQRGGVRRSTPAVRRFFDDAEAWARGSGSRGAR